MLLCGGSTGVTLAESAHLSHRLVDQSGDSFVVKWRRNETESSTMEGCLKYFLVLRRPDNDYASWDGRVFYFVDKVNPGAVGKLSIRKDQMRVGLLQQAEGTRATSNAEGIHPETPEDRLQRLAWLGTLMCYKSKGNALQGVPLPSPDARVSSNEPSENRTGRQEQASVEHTVFQPHPHAMSLAPASRRFRLITI